MSLWITNDQKSVGTDSSLVTEIRTITDYFFVVWKKFTIFRSWPWARSGLTTRARMASTTACRRRSSRLSWRSPSEWVCPSASTSGTRRMTASKVIIMFWQDLKWIICPNLLAKSFNLSAFLDLSFRFHPNVQCKEHLQRLYKLKLLHGLHF